LASATGLEPLLSPEGGWGPAGTSQSLGSGRSGGRRLPTASCSGACDGGADTGDQIYL